MILRAALAALLLSAALPAAAGEPPPPFALSVAGDNPLVGKIWQPATGRFLDFRQLSAAAAQADALLLGETHDNPDHHALQAWLVREMVAAGRRPVVAFEMMDSSQRQALDDHFAARPGDAAGLGEALQWDKSGWPDWSLYRPIAEAALAAGGPVLPANLSRDDTRALARGQAPDLAGRLGLDRPLDDATQAAMAAEIQSSHCGMLPDKSLPAMVRVQRARDAIMAETLGTALATGRQAVLIAGAGHTRTDRAVPFLLAGDRPDSRILSVAFVEVRDGETDPAAYGAGYDAALPPFDVVMFTPGAERDDQCEAFRRHMEKKNGKKG